MSWPRVFASRFTGLFVRARLERELDDEVRFHVDMLTEDNLRAGMSSSDARRGALKSFGAIEPMKERHRERWTFSIVDTIAQDVRYTVRTLRNNLAFTMTAVVTLTLATAATTVMLGVINAVLLRPLPYRAPEQLAMLWTGPHGDNPQGRAAYQTTEEWRRRSRSFSDLAIVDPVSATLAGVDGAERIGVARVSSNIFELLGVQLERGRMFSPLESEERRPVAVIGQRFWRAHLGTSPDVIGSFITLDGHRSEIVGVLREDVAIPHLDADVWEPHTLSPDWDTRRQARGAGSWFVLARLQGSTTVAQAQAEMTAIAHRLDEEWPSDRIQGATVVSLSHYFVAPIARMALWLLLVAALCVALIAAANVAGLSVARSVARAGEFSIRAALGASPRRIAAQVLVENVTLAAIANGFGALLAVAVLRLIRAFGPLDLRRLNEANLDARVLAGAFGISLLIGLFVSVMGPMALFRRATNFSIGRGARRVSGSFVARNIRRALVIAECALAIMLMAGAGLLIRSWLSIGHVEPGFETGRVLSIQLQAPTSVAPAQRAGFYADVLGQVQSVPGVERAGLIGDLFVTNDDERVITIEDGTTSPRFRLRHDEVSDRLFATIGATIVRGRAFSAEDNARSPRVAIVNETMARRFWGGRNAVGTQFMLGQRDSNTPWFTVVGLVSDMRREGLESEPIPQMFVPLEQDPSRLETLLVRTMSEEPLAMAPLVLSAIRRVEKQTPLYGVTTLDEQLGTYLDSRRFHTALLIAFAIVALAMAAIGIYGLVHYSVAMRTQEIGIRVALGARSGDIVRMVLREGLQLGGVGLAIGLAGALLMGRAASSLLFDVTPADPLTLFLVASLLAAIVAIACYLPARRATKIDPLVALRIS